MGAGFAQFSLIYATQRLPHYIRPTNLINSSWGHATPDAYSGGVEGANLDLAYTYMSLRNRGLSRLIVKS